MNNNKLKEEIKKAYNCYRDILIETSLSIFNNPELGLEEEYASNLLSSLLKNAGFETQEGIGEFNTAFVATYSTGEGITIGYVAEYDALPELGHACGHNIIGTSSVAAAIILKDIMVKYHIKGTIKVIGTPAEENFGCKADLIKLNVFKGIDYAMMLHPADASMYQDISFACAHIQYKFQGVSAHSAAAPWRGKSALNGVIQLFNSSNALRLHFKDHCRLHGIITEGGTVDNIIPESAIAIFNIRALESKYLEHMIERMEECALGSAMVTGTEVEITQVGNLYKEVRNDKYLEGVLKNNFDFMHEKTIERTLDQGIGSTDMGNLTHEIPAIHAYIKLKDNAITHTREFALYSGGEEGKIALEKSSIILAMSGLDIFTDNKKNNSDGMITPINGS